MDYSEIFNCNKYDPVTNKPNMECILKVMKQLDECRDHKNFNNLSDEYLLKYGINSRKFK